jgi:hypothetical protein
MDTIKPIERNKYLGAVVDALRSMRSGAGQLPTVPKAIAEFVLPSQGGTDELENWAYGNSPVQMPEMSNIPQLKSNRKAGDVLDAATALPVGAAAKGGKALSTAALVPILKGSRGELIQRASIADDLLKEGATAKDIWDKTQLHKVLRPGEKPGTRRALDAKWAHELVQDRSKSLELFNPNLAMGDDELSDLLRKHGSGRNTDEAFERLITAGLPKPGDYKLMPDHPLLKEYPQFKDTPVSMFKNQPGMNRSGNGSITDGKIEVNTPTLFTSELDMPAHAARVNFVKPEETLLHEVQHAIQGKFGTPRGSNPSEMGYVRRLYDPAKTHVQALRQADLPQHPGVAAALADNTGLSNYGRYRNVAGEQEASAAALREMIDPGALARAPIRDFKNPGEAITPQQWQAAALAYEQAARGGAASPELMSNLLRMFLPQK